MLILRSQSRQLNQIRQFSGIYRKYEEFLEKRFPRVYTYHRLIVDGCKLCGNDVKNFYVVNRDLRQHKRKLSDLTQTELQSFIQTKEEIAKIVVIATLAPLPLTFYGILFSVIFFPRLVLTRHFWTDKQKDEFWRLFYERSSKPHMKKLEHKKVPLNKINQIQMPDLNDYELKYLFHLFRLHRVSMLGGTKGLKKRVEAMKQLDRTMAADLKTIDEMPLLQIKNHLFMRRLEYADKTEKQMRDLLRQWITSKGTVKHYFQLASTNSTVYLHAPVFIR
ncbi:Letm1 RBD domain-containing protein [Aphelenchoides besseyi]|nr:Letm1 RBD domain-containing protein [Aphelenchoides besseyi]KAI6210435.1 Letm1 RBD domain-containing protein [Aphelenchoides besseyi]